MRLGRGVAVGIVAVLVVGGAAVLTSSSHQRASSAGRSIPSPVTPASPPAPTALASPGVAPPAGFQTTIANIWVGTKLYLRSDADAIGTSAPLVSTIRQIDDDHVFPDGSAKKGVLVQYPNGTVDWIPREFVHRAYVTRSP